MLNRWHGQLASPRVRLRVVTVVTAAVVGVSSLASILVLAAPPEASVGGSTGLAAGFGLLLLSAGFATASAVQYARGRRWGPFRRGALGWGVLAIAVAVVGCATLVGNFRVAHVELTVVDKDARVSSKSSRYWLVGRDSAAQVPITRDIYDATVVGSRVRCTGVRPPVIRDTLTRCERLDPAR